MPRAVLIDKEDENEEEMEQQGKDRSIVDAAKPPSAEFLRQLYQKDSRMDEARDFSGQTKIKKTVDKSRIA